MTNNAIDVRHAGRHFGDVVALDDVSLSIGAGSMVGLIGHNGAGKSTLFKLMLGLLAPSAGDVLVHGVPTGARAFRNVRRRIGYLPETFVTYDNLTGMEVLHLFADLKRVPRAACAAVLERVGLGQAAQRRVHGYSKGMRQRLGFAQVLLGSPDLIFLDEPTNGLDPEGIHDFYRILRDVQAQGATIVITSHILAEIQERVDELVILQAGRIAAQGTLADLRARLALPSEIRIVPRRGEAARTHAALAHLAGLASTIDADCVRVACLPGQKLAVLGVLAALADAVHDVAIHEPSLEDLFLGYGGADGRQH
jgi:Cu-processing system ATP-binding protein